MKSPALLLILFLGLSPYCFALDKAAERSATFDELAAKIDQEIEAEIERQSAKVTAAADDYEFLRRVSLDLCGRIPTTSEIHKFISDQRPAKRNRLVDELLERPRHASHLAHVWRDWLVPELSTIPHARYFQPGFEAWLSRRFYDRSGYDLIVRELLSVPLPGDKEQAEHVFRDLNRPNALAFYAVKDAQPDRLAATATRAFLSIQLECAQCHAHPFAEWTQDQFWNQAAFFAGLERQGDGLFAPLIEISSRRTISPGQGKAEVGPAYLFGNQSTIDAGAKSRSVFADWVTSRENLFFARSAVNRIWALMFGVGLIHPIDDFHDNNPPSHPIVLDLLSQAFIQNGYDVDVVFRIICRTKAYQRTSACSAEQVSEPRLFARMLTKGLSADQAWDSLSLAVGWVNQDSEREGSASPRASGRRAFFAQFTPRSWPAEPETSVAQALAFMNGDLLSRATSLDHSPTLIAITESPDWSDDERVDALYFATLGRPPRPDERERLRAFLVDRPNEQKTQRYEDLLWVLLNSSEFRLNH